MLPVLQEAGVVDAGAAGLVEIVRGIHAVAERARRSPAPPERVADEVAIEAIHQELSRYRYCTVFVVEGEDLDADDARARARAARRLAARRRRPVPRSRCTSTPTTRAARSRSAVARGVVGGVEIANMHEQTAASARSGCCTRVPDVAASTTAVVAVASGDGNRALFESFGARVVDGGRTMNPSTADIVAAIEAAPAREVSCCRTTAT